MIITIFGFCPYGPVIIYCMGCGREEITWFSGGEDAGGGGGFGGFWGDHMVFRGEDGGGPEDFGEITWFSGREEGGGEIGRHQRSLKGEFWKIDCPPSSPSP